MVKGFKRKPYEEWLRLPGLFSLKKGRLRGHLIVIFYIFMGVGGGTGADLFSVSNSIKARGNVLKLCQGRFKLDMRERLDL